MRVQKLPELAFHRRRVAADSPSQTLRFIEGEHAGGAIGQQRRLHVDGDGEPGGDPIADGQRRGGRGRARRRGFRHEQIDPERVPAGGIVRSIVPDRNQGIREIPQHQLVGRSRRRQPAQRLGRAAIVVRAFPYRHEVLTKYLHARVVLRGAGEGFHGQGRGRGRVAEDDHLKRHRLASQGRQGDCCPVGRQGAAARQRRVAVAAPDAQLVVDRHHLKRGGRHRRPRPRRAGQQQNRQSDLPRVEHPEQLITP